SFSTNHGGVPIGPVIPLSGPPCPASITTNFRARGLITAAVRGGRAGVLTDSGTTGIGAFATAVELAGSLAGELIGTELPGAGLFGVGFICAIDAKMRSSPCATSYEYPPP